MAGQLAAALRELRQESSDDCSNAVDYGVKINAAKPLSLRLQKRLPLGTATNKHWLGHDLDAAHPSAETFDALLRHATRLLTAPVSGLSRPVLFLISRSESAFKRIETSVFNEAAFAGHDKTQNASRSYWHG